MSVRGYIINEEVIWVDKINMTFQYNNDGENLERFTHSSQEFCFNLWRQPKFLNMILKYCCYDGRNDDSCGIIEMMEEDFRKMLKENIFNDEADLESILIIKKYFDKGFNLITFDCY